MTNVMRVVVLGGFICRIVRGFEAQRGPTSNDVAKLGWCFPKNLRPQASEALRLSGWFVGRSGGGSTFRQLGRPGWPPSKEPKSLGLRGYEACWLDGWLAGWPGSGMFEYLELRMELACSDAPIWEACGRMFGCWNVLVFGRINSSTLDQRWVGG